MTPEQILAIPPKVLSQAQREQPLPVEFVQALQALGLAGTQPLQGEPLTGGVSSDIWRIDTDRGPVCAKTALARLRVAADWCAPIERNVYEARWTAAQPALAQRFDSQAIFFEIRFRSSKASSRRAAAAGFHRHFSSRCFRQKARSKVEVRSAGADGGFPHFFPTRNENATRRWRKSLIRTANLGGRCRA